MTRIQKASDIPRGEVTAKDMSVLRDEDSAQTEHRANFGYLRDYSLQHRVKVSWDLNEEARRERIFRLRVDDYEVLLDAEQVLRLLRWV